MATGLVLSGGGAKGSFELGALQYLYKFGFSPDIICSTSVGSVNGLKLAEGEGSPDQGFSGLQQIWFNMKTNQDMYDEEGWLKGSADWIKRAIYGSSGGLIGLPGFLEGAILVAIPGVAADYLDDLKKFADNLKANKSLYHLEPIRALAKRHMDQQKVVSSGIKLRMAAVGMESGSLRYVTEFGRLLDDPKSPSDDPSSPQVSVIDGMLASAAIPAVFRPQKLANEWYVDGGVREVVPIAAAVAMGATDIYAVVAPIPLQQDTSYDSKGVVDFANRSVDAVTDEVTIKGIYPRGGWGGSFVFILRPNLEVEPSRTIDPGLIRINSDYGYMRAFDTLEQLSAPLRAQLVALSDAIARTRKTIWDKELNIWQTYAEIETANGTEATASILATLYNVVRGYKNEVRRLVECRLSLAGFESVSSITPIPIDWWLDWEAHGPGWTNFVSGSPWDEVSFIGYHYDPSDPSPYVYSVSVPEGVSDPRAVPCPKLFYTGSTPTGAYIQGPPFGTTYELVLIRKAKIEHFHLNLANGSGGWQTLGTLPLPPSAGKSGKVAGISFTPASISLVAGNPPITLANIGGAIGAFVGIAPPEPVVQLEALVHFKTVIGEGDYLGTYVRTDSGWSGPNRIYVNGALLDGLTTEPAWIRGNWGNAGNYELIVARNNKIEHYARINDDPNRPWVFIDEIPVPQGGEEGKIASVPHYPVAINFLQSSFPHTLFPNGNLELFVVFRSSLPDTASSHLATYYFDAHNRNWNGPYPITVDGKLLDNVSGRPAIAQRAANGDFELLVVREGSVVEHYRRSNSNHGMPWHKQADVFKGGKKGKIATTSLPDSVALFQSAPDQNLQAIIHLSTLGGSAAGGYDHSVTYYFSEDDRAWHGPTHLTIGGSDVDNVDPF